MDLAWFWGGSGRPLGSHLGSKIEFFRAFIAISIKIRILRHLGMLWGWFWEGFGRVWGSGGFWQGLGAFWVFLGITVFCWAFLGHAGFCWRHHECFPGRVITNAFLGFAFAKTNVFRDMSSQMLLRVWFS